MAYGEIEHSVIGQIDGQDIDAYRLTGGETTIEVMTYAAIMTRVMRPDRDGKIEDIVVGYDDPASYVTNPGNASAICGRCSNRIANGEFTLEGETYHIPQNLPPHACHGGFLGFGKRIWKAFPDPENNAVTFRLHSPDGDQGFPGTMEASATYKLDEEGVLELTFEAETDKASPVNIIYHGYWNLAGHKSGSIENQFLQVFADRYTKVTDEKIPTGEIAPVTGTCFDFTNLHPIGDAIADAWPGGGYDVNLCLKEWDGTMRLAAKACDKKSGRGLAIYTDQPGIQFYTAQHFKAAPTPGKEGALYDTYAGFALETQHYPDSPNHENFPSVILKPGATYRHCMKIVFSKDEA